MFAPSCSEIGKEVAKNDLEGAFKGTTQTLLQFSKLNIGLEDEMVPEPEKSFFEIKRNESEGIYFDMGEGVNLKIDNVQLATNGSTFNIPEQTISVYEQRVLMQVKVKGLNAFLNGESRCDGFYDTEKNVLTFSYGGNLLLAIEGEELNVPFSTMYTMSKMGNK